MRESVLQKYRDVERDTDQVQTIKNQLQRTWVTMINVSNDGGNDDLHGNWTMRAIKGMRWERPIFDRAISSNIPNLWSVRGRAAVDFPLRL